MDWSGYRKAGDKSDNFAGKANQPTKSDPSAKSDKSDKSNICHLRSEQAKSDKSDTPLWGVANVAALRWSHVAC
jgi:hypothetical protein